MIKEGLTSTSHQLFVGVAVHGRGRDRNFSHIEMKVNALVSLLYKTLRGLFYCTFLLPPFFCTRIFTKEVIVWSLCARVRVCVCALVIENTFCIERTHL